MPGTRTSSPTPSGSSQHSQPRHSPAKRQKVQHTQHMQHMQQLQYHLADTDTAVSSASSFSAGSSVEQDCLEIEQPAFFTSKKRSRLVACSVYEVGWLAVLAGWEGSWLQQLLLLLWETASGQHMCRQCCARIRQLAAFRCCSFQAACHTTSAVPAPSTRQMRESLPGRAGVHTACGSFEAAGAACARQLASNNPMLACCICLSPDLFVLTPIFCFLHVPCCPVPQVDPITDCVLRCKRTFETPDGGVVTVVRRMRKQLKPRASSS